LVTDAAYKPGDLVAKRYALEAHLGSGSAAEVWRAADTTMGGGAHVAIKILHLRFAEGDIARRFLREAKMAAKIRSLHIVEVLDHGTCESGAPFLAMELLEGETLAERLERDGGVPAPDVCRIVGHIAKAASKAHAIGIIHRDLKPHNVFLVKDGGEEITKVFDFGIAKVTSAASGLSTSITASKLLMGTPEYMSPEQASFGDVDYRTDLYALGIIAFECLTGKTPFLTEDVIELLDQVAKGQLLVPSDIAPLPPAFDAWFARATCHDPAGRFSTGKELAAALHEALGVAPETET
jgi:eukaryotic-like serine/threonine-protein kinase